MGVVTEVGIIVVFVVFVVWEVIVVVIVVQEAIGVVIVIGNIQEISVMCVECVVMWVGVKWGGCGIIVLDRVRWYGFGFVLRS